MERFIEHSADGTSIWLSPYPAATAPVVRRAAAPADLVHRWHAGVPLGSGKQRQLLATLLLMPNEVIGAAQQIAALWVDEPPASALANLRTYVLGLRRLLDAPDTPPRIVADAGGYLLRVRQQERDVDRFDAAASRGRACLAVGDAAMAQAELTVAVDMWRGDPLADVPLSPLTAGRVAALTERYLLAEEDLAEATLQLGTPAETVRRLRALLPVRVGDQHVAGSRSHAAVVAPAIREVISGCGTEVSSVEPGDDTSLPPFLTITRHW
ncbi:BTAD domain-containing putative transcriptional regulator [Micromonospora sp. NBC_01412]|uniref:AfsR/SARP family transcriptional regulator n=1 Tax=Micromonospora sp. NBC_01412 TaxID=2903590 RepID=UPI003255C1E6